MLSVIVLAWNEEKHLGACLESVREFADELIVLDSGNNPRIAEIVDGMGAKREFRLFDNYPNHRNAAIDLARGDWILFIDADERGTIAFSKELREQIALSDERRARFEPALVGFWVPRRNMIFGKWIRHAGWSPDFQPRVVKKGFGRFDAKRAVHELLIWDGDAGYLREPLIHYNYETLAQFRQKQIAYTRYEARVWFEEGRRARLRGFIGQPIREFFRRFISLQGWRDGAHGLLLSVLMSYYAFVRQLLLWRLGANGITNSRTESRLT
jgi:glycosyltransferase involved in cell wall biosynthesis